MYVVPAEGGVPKRLTWHPGPDVVQGFTPDGKAVLFSSGRAAYTGATRSSSPCRSRAGSRPGCPSRTRARRQVSPDGQTIAYNPLPPAFDQWKQYRGGTVSRIWLYDNASYAVEKVPQPAGRCNDVDPMWVGSRLYFRSDRDGEFNLYAYDSASKAVTRLTSHADFPVLKASAGGGKIAYEQAGYLHLLDPATGASTRLKLGVAADLVEMRAPLGEGSEVHPRAAACRPRARGRPSSSGAKS